MVNGQALPPTLADTAMRMRLMKFSLCDAGRGDGARVRLRIVLLFRLELWTYSPEHASSREWREHEPATGGEFSALSQGPGDDGFAADAGSAFGFGV